MLPVVFMAALDAAERTMTKPGASLVAKAAIGSGSLANSVDKALAGEPDSILLISDALGAAGAVRDLRAKGFRAHFANDWVASRLVELSLIDS